MAKSKKNDDSMERLAPALRQNVLVTGIGRLSHNTFKSIVKVGAFNGDDSDDIDDI